MKYYSDEEDAMLRKLRRQNVPTEQIAERIDRSPSSVRWRMRQLGIAYPNGKGRSNSATLSA